MDSLLGVVAVLRAWQQVEYLAHWPVSTDKLIKDTEEGNLHYAIVPGSVNYYDIICHELFEQRLILIHTPDIELTIFEELFETDRKQAEKWLSGQQWYSHRSVTPFIKQI